MDPNLIRVIIVIAVVAIVQFIKNVICKGDEKYKLLYTFAPIILCALAFFIMALIQKTDIWSALLTGGALGITCMGSYDALVAILSGWKDKTPTELAKEVEEVIGPKAVAEK